MNQPARNNPPKPKKIHELIGKVLSKDLRKSYEHKKNCPQSELKAGQECPQANCYYGSAFWRLNVALENSSVERIYVYQAYLEKEQVWKDVLESNYIDQRYLFLCSKSRKTGNYQLTNWRVLKPKEVNHE